MPKKTKHKKILTSFRNKLKHQEEIQSVSRPSSTISVQKETQKTLVVLKDNNTNKITNYFKHDFTKSLILISGIITLELIFYFVSMNSSLRSIFKFIP